MNIILRVSGVPYLEKHLTSRQRGVLKGVPWRQSQITQMLDFTKYKSFLKIFEFDSSAIVKNLIILVSWSVRLLCNMWGQDILFIWTALWHTHAIQPNLQGHFMRWSHMISSVSKLSPCSALGGVVPHSTASATSNSSFRNPHTVGRMRCLDFLEEKLKGSK